MKIWKFWYFAAALLPFQGISVPIKSKSLLCTKWIILNSVKLSILDSDRMGSLVEKSDEISRVASSIQANVSDKQPIRRELGLAIRNWGDVKTMGGDWPFAIA